MDLVEEQQGPGAADGDDNAHHRSNAPLLVVLEEVLRKDEEKELTLLVQFLREGDDDTASFLLRRQEYYPYYHELIGRLHYETWSTLLDRKYACCEYVRGIVDHEVDQAYYLDNNNRTGIRRLSKEELLDYMRQRFRDEKRKRSLAVDRNAVAVNARSKQEHGIMDQLMAMITPTNVATLRSSW
jgi:hypothetical protein